MLVSLFFNCECTSVWLHYGDIFQLDVEASAGFCSVVTWCLDSIVALRVESKNFVSEQCGRIASICFHIANSTLVSLSITVCRRQLTGADCECASDLLIALKCFIMCDENGAKTSEDVSSAISIPAHELLRSAKLTFFVTTFLANEEEFYVAKKKNSKMKRTHAPLISVRIETYPLMRFITSGSKSWRKATASFSTLMRFVQKSRTEFSWVSEQSATLIDKRSLA